MRPETTLYQKGEAISPRVRLFPLRVRLFTMGEAISPRVRLFPLRVRLFQDITSPWAPVGAKNVLLNFGLDLRNEIGTSSYSF